MLIKKLFGWLGIGLLLAACQDVVVVLPTAVSPAEVVVVVTETAVFSVPATWTPSAPVSQSNGEQSGSGQSAGEQPGGVAIPVPTSQPQAKPTRFIPTNTPVPPPTATPKNTAVPVTKLPTTSSPTPTATTTATPVATGQPVGSNLLPNPSFEWGYYSHPDFPEMQLPNGWTFEWDEGSTGYGNQPWDVWVRPEIHVLSRENNSAAPYIWDGNSTVNVFKEKAAISYRLFADIELPPGTYQLKISYFPDLVMGYDGSQKLYANDPIAGEVRIFAGGNVSGWLFPRFGERNTAILTFNLDKSRTMRIGFAARGRFALDNNGWFMDGWSLYRLQ